MLQALRADGSVPSIDPEAEDGVTSALTYQHSFDVAKMELVEHFEAHTKALLTDTDSSVRRALLGSVSSLCVFFGSSKANDVILSHLNTYLNDKDWILKCAFFRTIVGVATFVGGTSLEEFILPLMIQSLTDPEEFVVEKVLSSFASMAELGLFQRSKLWDMVDIVARFTIHPNIWIREAAAHFISASTKYLTIADLHCVLSPLLLPYLKTPILDFAELNILDSIKRPLPRPILESAILWATKEGNGLFWKPVQQHKTFSFGSAEQALPIPSSKNPRINTLNKIVKNSEDERWIKRLQNIGMGTDDEFKLLALREYIWRIAQKRAKLGSESSATALTSILRLKEMDVTPQTIFFETQRTKSKTQRRASAGEHHSSSIKDSEAAPHTIADALLDASTAIDGPLTQHQRSLISARKERFDIDNVQAQALQLNLKPHSSNLTSPRPGSPADRVRSRDRSGRSAEKDARRRSSDRTNIAQSDGTITPTDSLRTGHGRNGGVQHKASAIQLLNRRDTSKTIAETSTTPTNAFGKVDGPFTQEPPGVRPDEAKTINEKRGSSSANYSGHTYDGTDPSVLRLLDSLASDNFPHDVYDFGPLVTPVSSKSHVVGADSQRAQKHWRPEGTLVATFGEHTGPINRVLPSPDHAFFITGSDDGSVKIWDTLRLERNLAHRSRQTYKHAEGAKVQCLCFVENTHTFVSGATDGSINVVKVDFHLVGDTSKYGKLRMMREYHFPGDEYAVWIHHWKSDSNSVLLIATNTSRILALDLRNMTILYSFQNPIHHGTLTCFHVDHNHTWMLLGTSHGVLDLWDLRFHLRLKSWGLGGGTPIHRLFKYPFKQGHKWICIAGGTGQTDITVWDVEKIECRQVYRASITKSSSSKENLKVYEPWKVDDEKPEGMLGRFATAIDPSVSNNSISDRGIRALAIGVDSPDSKGESRHGFFITGGADRKLRCWDVSRPELSTVISGLDAEEDQPKFSTSQPTTSLVINSERVANQAPSAPNAAAGASPGKKSSIKQPRSTVISVQQQHLLRSHLDSILDVCVLESPVGMTVSVDRLGCIYVFQ